MTDIPDIVSAVVGVYLHKFVNWDIDEERYVSAFDKERTKDKVREIEDIILLGATSAELDFLCSIEKDTSAKKLLKKATNIWKSRK